MPKFVEQNKFDSNRKNKNKNWILKFLILVSMITVYQISYSQNTGWVMAPYYTKNTNGQTLRYNLPRPIDFFQDASGNTNENNYNGEEGKSCGVFDNYGNLQLFMVNSNIYDGNGYLLYDGITENLKNRIINEGNSFNSFFNVYNNIDAFENLILPVPQKCNEFYIISRVKQENLYRMNFFYSKLSLDFANENYSTGKVMGKLIKAGENNDFFQQISTLSPSFEIPLPEIRYQFYEPKYSITSDIGNSTFLLIIDELVTKVNSDGITPLNENNLFATGCFCQIGELNYDPFVGYSFINPQTPSEIELFQIPDNPNKFKIARTFNFYVGEYPNYNLRTLIPGDGFPDDQGVYTVKQMIEVFNFEIDLISNEIIIDEQSKQNFHLPLELSDDVTKVSTDDPKGLEFSPDGQKLYVSSSRRLNITEPFSETNLWYFDFTEIANSVTVGNGDETLTFYELKPLIQSSSLTNNNIFTNCAITKNLNNELIFVTTEGIKHKITNPNNPQNPLWNISNNSNVSFSYSQLATSGIVGGGVARFYTQLELQPFNGNLLGLMNLSDATCCTRWIPNYKRELTSNSLDIFIPPNGNAELLLAGANINGTVTIGNGTNLSLNNQTINFGPNGKIILEENSTFISNNCTFKSIDECPVLWKGIEVRGNNNFNQENYSAQLILNNSTISDATKGIAVSKLLPDGNPVLNSGSGIVKATNSNFENNYIDVEFYPYSPRLYGSYTPTSLLNNLSFFKTCNFYTNLPVLKDNQRMPYAHVKMNNVRNVSFKKCNFYNTNSNLDYAQQYGYGILSIDAQLKIGEYNSDSYTPPNTFVNLYQGIAAYGSSTFNSSTIINNRFENCRIGILTGGLFNSVISKNTFKNYLDESPVLPILSGNSPQIFEYFSNSVIDDNTFTNYNSSSSNSNGILIKNNTDIANYTNLNKFNNFATAQYFKGFTPAFKFRCNQNQNNQLDVLNATNSTIANIQGDNSPILPTSAANQFTQGASINLQNDGNTFTYVFNPTTPFETPIALGDVILNEIWNAASVCNPLIENYVWNGGGNPGGFISKLELANTYNAQLLGIIDAISYVKDGGNTDSLISLIKKDIPGSEHYQKVQELLNKSPNLSKEVLMEIAESSDFSNFEKLELLRANPKAGADKELLQKLSEGYNPLNEAMIEYIRNGRANFSFLQFLENKAVNKELQRNVVLQNLFLELQLDSLGLDSTKMQQVLNIYHNPQAKAEQAYWAMQSNNFEMADLLINQVKPKYDRELSAELDDENFWINKMIELYSNQKNPYQLEKTEKDIIRDFALNHNSKAATKAKGFMQYFYNENLIDGTNNSARIAQVEVNKLEVDYHENKNLTETISNFTFAPNPANEFLYINSKYLNQKIVISDTNGKIIKLFQVNTTRTKIDISGIHPGLYLISCDNHYEKLVINR
jgi:uncharacterized protein Smg (DUF494 family)